MLKSLDRRSEHHHLCKNAVHINSMSSHRDTTDIFSCHTGVWDINGVVKVMFLVMTVSHSVNGWERHHTGPRPAPSVRALTPLPSDMFKLVHYEGHFVGERAVRILLEGFLVSHCTHLISCHRGIRNVSLFLRVLQQNIHHALRETGCAADLHLWVKINQLSTHK